jgi:hypothetical protein
MSTSAVSSASLYQQLQSYFQSRTSDLKQLGQALDQGNLSAAQTAYNNIVTLGQSGPAANGDPFLNSTREEDFSAIGTALQAGDLSGAQQAFATLKATAQQQSGTAAPVGPTPAPASSSPASSAGPEIVLNLSNTGTSSSPEDITINLSSTANGGEQIGLSIGAQGSSNPQQITFNLPANSNEQIVLNLLGATSTAGSSDATSGSGLSVSA